MTFDARIVGAPGLWVPFGGNWPNVPVASWQVSRYMRVGNTVTVRQVATLSSGIGPALIDMPFSAAFPVFSSVAPVGTVKAIRSGIGWYEGWLYQTSVTPDRLVLISRTAGTASAANWGAAFPAAWVAGNQWGIDYTFEALPA